MAILEHIKYKYSIEAFKKIIKDVLELKSYENIEIEARLGRIKSLVTQKRVEIDVEHPIVFMKLPTGTYFENGVEAKDFTTVRNLVVGDDDTEHGRDCVTISNKIRKIESETGVRYEKKIRRTNVDVYLPWFKYDVRVSVSSEKPEEAKSFKAGRGMVVRSRERETYRGGAMRFDFTKTLNRDGGVTGFEVEVELVDAGRGLDRFIEGIFVLPVVKY